uniref:Uncharacterized protein n=1 Tax=Cannabis sativa TaxID=3483 RepID=A0A803PNC2_CANSA
MDPEQLKVEGSMIMEKLRRVRLLSPHQNTTPPNSCGICSDPYDVKEAIVEIVANWKGPCTFEMILLNSFVKNIDSRIDEVRKMAKKIKGKPFGS